MKKHISKILFNLIIALFLEVIIFNITSYRILLGNYEKKTFVNPKFVQYEKDDTIAILEIDNLNIDVATFKIEFKPIIIGAPEYQVFFSDESSEKYLMVNPKTYIENDEKSKYVPLFISGKANGIAFAIDKNLYENHALDKIVLNEKIPFEFNVVRFLITFGILLVIYFFKNAEIFNEKLELNSKIQKRIVSFTILVFSILLIFINRNSIQPDEQKIYNEKFVNAIYNGNLYLDFEPSEEFLKLDSPYDFSARNSLNRGNDYIWDTAYFNGKFYVYFGILPLLVFFLPFYIVTKKYLDISIVILILSIAILILFKLILEKVFNRYFKELDFKTFLLSLIIICSGSLVIYANGMSRVYELVIIAGLYCVLQGIYFILKSMENEKRKYLNIFLGCLFMALSVACRPTDLFASIIILPYLIKLFIENIKKLKNKKSLFIKLLFAVIIPYASVGILLMIYNYLRFNNPFDFGSKYQLTYGNMYATKNRLVSIPAGLIANFFAIPNFILDFPFIELIQKIPVFYGYYYIEKMLGGMFCIAPICFMNFLVFKLNKKSKNAELKTIINFLIITGLIISVISVMFAGSNQRYLIDYTWMFILSGILIFITLFNSLKSNETKIVFKKIYSTLTIFMVFMGIFTGIVSEKEFMKTYSPDIYYKMKYSICFWE